MTSPMDDLLKKIRILEAGVPPEIRADPNFTGLRLDAAGDQVYIGKNDFPNGNSRSASIVGAVDTRLANSEQFKAAKVAAGVELADQIDPTKNDLLSSCCAGDGGYAVTEGLDEPAVARRKFGTLGWFFLLDGTPACISCYHVLCQASDATDARKTAVFQRDPSTAGKDVRIGALWKFDHLDKADPPIFDLALAKLDKNADVLGEFGLLDDNTTQRPYPMCLACDEAINADDDYFLVGAMTRCTKTTKFKGIGSRIGAGGYMFFEQLFFEGKCSKDGDSGAIIVHAKTNSVVGLCTMSGLYTVASPLYRKRWIAAGTEAWNGVTLPSLISPFV